MKFGLRKHLAVALLSFGAILLAPSLSKGGALASTGPFAVNQYINICPSTIQGCSSDISGVDIDRQANVVYFVTSDPYTGAAQLVRVDGNTDTVVGTPFNLPNCFDPRRPAVAHNVVTKIYIGCEDSHDVLVVQVRNGRSGNTGSIGSLFVKTRISLAIRNRGTYEPKTERASDGSWKVYVVGDNPGDLCEDPAFAISTSTDTLTQTNIQLGTPASSDCDLAGHTGINDVAPAGGTAVWFNEDDQRVYQTLANLTLLGKSVPLSDPCYEDAPTFGDVNTSGGEVRVLAGAIEAGSDCSSGILYTLLGSTLTGTLATPGFSPGRIAAALNGFLVSGQTDAVGEPPPGGAAPGCDPSCAEIHNINGTLAQRITLDAPQVDVAFSQATGKAYLPLDYLYAPGKSVAILKTTP